MTTTSPLGDQGGKPGMGAIRGSKTGAYVSMPRTDSGNPDTDPALSMLPGNKPTSGTRGRSTYPNLGL